MAFLRARHETATCCSGGATLSVVFVLVAKFALAPTACQVKHPHAPFLQQYLFASSAGVVATNGSTLNRHDRPLLAWAGWATRRGP